MGEQQPAASARVKEGRPGGTAGPARQPHSSQQALRWSLIVTAAVVCGTNTVTTPAAFVFLCVR